MATTSIARKRKDLSTPMLPLDVISTEIFARLPARSLIRFKCLSKFFRTHISSKEFIDLHLHRTRSCNTNGLLMLLDRCLSFESILYLMDLNFTSTTMMELPYPQNSNGIPNENTRINFVGSCNGLTCFVHSSIIDVTGKEHVLLLNPYTRVSKFGIPIERCEPGVARFGFGYDSINDDYKVVRHNIYLGKNYNHDYQYIKQVEVYSARANSWRCIEKTRTQHFYHSPSLQGVLLNNNLVHWILLGLTDSQKQLVCFNVESESWMPDLPLPEIDHFVIDFRVITGYLGLFSFYVTHYNLWVMKKYGVKESWVNLMRVDKCENSVRLSDTCLVYSVHSAYRRETRREEILVKVKSEFGSTLAGGVYCWYNARDGKLDRLQDIPSNLTVVASSIGSLVNIV